MRCQITVNRISGIGLMCLAMFVLACMDAMSKHLAAHYPISQILAVRFWLFSGFAVLIFGRGRLREALRTDHLWLQIVRSLVIACEVAVFVLAFRYLPLAEVHAIAGIAPLLVTALAVPFLGERVGIRRWLAVLAGFVGLLVILRPGLKVFEPAALIPLAGASLWAVYQLLVRTTSSDSAATMLLYTSLVGAVVTGLIAPFQWIAPDAQGWVLLVALGIVGSLGHWLLIRAIQSAPASSLQPFHYTILLWATLVGYLVFDELPDGWTIAGACIIVSGGLYAWQRERRVAAA